MMDQNDLKALTELADEPSIEREGSFGAVNVEALVAEYRDLRDEKAAARKVYQGIEAECDRRMDEITVQLREISDATGILAFRTAAGTAYKQLKKHYRVGNWDDILHYIQATGNWQMLEKRIGKLATEEIHNTTGEIPPGVEYSAEYEFVVRKNSE